MVDSVQSQIVDCEKQLEAILCHPNAEQKDLLKTLPCVGKVLSAVIALEIGDVRRFGEAKYLVSYAGLVPSARESAERKRQGGALGDCNVYLKWAFVEAANLIASKQRHGQGVMPCGSQQRKTKHQDARQGNHGGSAN